MKKNLMKILLLSGFLAIASNVYADIPSANATTTSAAKAQNNSPIVFLQRGGSGVLQKNSDGYTLTIYNVSPSIVAIPTAITNSEQQKHFLSAIQKWSIDTYLDKAWGSAKGSFAQVNPNASVVADISGDAKTQDTNFFIQLMKAQYNATDKSMTYNIKLLSAKTQKLLDKKLMNISLFIDGACGGNPLCQMWLTPFSDSPPM